MAFDAEDEGAVGSTDVDGADVDALAASVRDRIVRSSQPGCHRVVTAHHLRARDLAEVRVEAVDDRLERPVVVEMVDLDVREDRPVERQLEVGAIALVRLDDEILPAGPLRTGAEIGDIATDDEARAQSGLGEHQHQHRRRGGLAVGPGNGE